MNAIENHAAPPPLLTIAIPTWNRAPFLRELLESLEPQLCNEPRVELIVSDNCSSDETPDIISEFVFRGLALRSIRNASNIGADPNFIQCFEQACGEFFWLIGDDDLLIPGAISAILDQLETGLYDMLYLSQFPVPKAGKKLAPVAHLEVIPCSDSCEYARRINVFFTFISANIVRKKAALESPPHDFSDLLNTNLVQLGWIYSALNRTRCSLFIKTPLLGARVDNAGGYRLFKVFGPNLKDANTRWLQNSCVAREIENGVLRNFLPGFSYKAKSAASPFSEEGSISSLLTPTFRDNPRYWLFVYPILVLPKLPATGWYAAIKIFNRLSRMLSA